MTRKFEQLTVEDLKEEFQEYLRKFGVLPGNTRSEMHWQDFLARLQRHCSIIETL